MKALEVPGSNETTTARAAADVALPHDGPHLAYRADIDGLRAIAVLAVLAYHAGHWLPGGFLGVDVFYVVSGFLITQLLRADARPIRAVLAGFYLRRVRRLAPALLVVLAFCLAVTTWFYLPPDYLAFGRSLALACVFVTNHGFYTEAGYFDTAAQIKPLLHTWSLAIEEQFYLLYPALLLALRRFGARAQLFAVSAFAAASLALCIWQSEHAPDAAFYLLPARFWELGAGAVLALAPALHARSSAAGAVSAGLGLAAIALAVLAIDGQAGAYALLPCIGAALVIAGGGARNPVSALLGARVPVAIGLLSYSLYLWHWPLLVFAQYLRGATLPWHVALAVLALAFALAWASWRFVEQPVRTRAVLAAPKALLCVVVLAAAVLGGMGRFAVHSNGWAERFPPALQEALRAHGERGAFRTRNCTLVGDWERIPSTLDALCVLGDAAAPPSFVLWGDSHAAALGTALDAAARRAGASGRAAARGNCAPLLGYAGYAGRHVAECQAFNRAMAKLVREHRIRLVVLAARWPAEVSGSPLVDEGPLYSPAAPLPPPTRAALVEAALRRTVRTLRGYGAEVLLVQEVPEPGYDVPYAIARSLWRGEGTPRIDPSRAAVLARQGPARAILARVARSEGAQLVDPLPYFCDARVCRLIEDGQTNYVDHNHIVARKSLQLSPLFDAALSDAALSAAAPPRLR